MTKWTEREPDNRRLIICYYQGREMMYWVNAQGTICDASTGLTSFSRNAGWKQAKIKEGYWKYVNYG